MNRHPFREWLYVTIFEADTPYGKAFDVALLWAIVLSVTAVALESVASIRQHYGPILKIVEWGFTILFTLEYFLRIYCARRPLLYMRSFFGVVDLLSVIPTYVSIFFIGGHYLLSVRALRLLRIFRVLKLASFLSEASILITALKASRTKIVVFLYTVLTLVLIIGTVMYLIEGEEHGFTSIPKSVYWAIVTLTTVGYGDLAPSTVMGQIFACVVMVLGYAIIAVPTGIVTAELASTDKERLVTKDCPGCDLKRHSLDALYCRSCGHLLHPEHC